MIIKVCGMRDGENIRAVEQLGIDWLGLIFAPRSARYVGQRPSYLPTRCKRVGVFVDEELNVVRDTAQGYGLDLIQLHGHETPEYVKELSEWKVVKVFNIATAADLAATQAYEGIADYFLFDTKAQLPGGNGTKFDWSVLSEYRGNTPYLLSGGIGPDDADRVGTFLADHHATPDGCPRCMGIDLNSRFETAPALKDVDSLKAFIKKTREYEQNQ